MIQQQKQCDTNSSSGNVGNRTQENFAELVQCPQCGVETRVDTPSVGLTNCNNDECGVRVFILDTTEGDKYGT